MKVFISETGTFECQYIWNALKEEGFEVFGPEQSDDTQKAVRSALDANILILVAVEDGVNSLDSAILAALEFGSFPDEKHVFLLSSLLTWARTLTDIGGEEDFFGDGGGGGG
eukprot:CAMPEP_0206378524 /NCGR_PEP_ID=MMETSP0294-20121207/10791_1 /ASSEMBLY_ACC=CAM_ASM_000327 /TAXON_ID=39354 /ORGANISM="Heterosigma akashiwo, Strain CCMP2393" /LENGTH=111 /DNA_ID=CAMNT_0053827181 /DNA_START=40 /DNA_END=372 /DNA_ORIENTATION=-